MIQLPQLDLSTSQSVAIHPAQLHHLLLHQQWSLNPTFSPAWVKAPRSTSQPPLPSPALTSVGGKCYCATASASSAADSSGRAVDFQKLPHLTPPSPLPCLCQSPALPGWTTSFCFHLANLQFRSIAKLGFQIFRKCQTTHHRHQSKINFVDSKGKAHVYIIIIKDTAGLTIDSRESSVYLYIEQINWDLNQYLMELLNMLKL